MPNAYVQVIGGPWAGSRTPIDGELVIGRTAGLDLGDPELSRRHARIYRGPDGALVVADLNSTNGTFVNGRRISDPERIGPRDRVRVGQSTLQIVEAPDAPPDATGQPPPAPGDRLAPAASATPTVPHDSGPPAAASAPAAPSVPAPVAPVVPASAPMPAPAPAPGPAPASAPMPAPGPPVEAGAGFAGQATLLAAGQRVDVPRGGLTIGREQDNALVVSTNLASRHHARIDLAPEGYYLTDLGSSNGTYLNGQRLHGESRWLHSGDNVRIGDDVLRFVAGGATRFVSPEELAQVREAMRLPGALLVDRDRLTIGRDRANDVVLSDPNVSRFHAELVKTPAGIEVRDLQSRNGTRLDGAPITRALLRTGSEVGIGQFRFVFDGEALRTRDERGALRLDAEGVSVTVEGDKQILHPVTLEVNPGEFVAIIGESGSGKSTLIKLLAGVSPPSEGHVTVSGDPVSLRQAEIGYVPQDEIVHPSLTVVEALRYAARLRLPRDSSPEEIEASVQEVIAELALGEHADTQIRALSGGQRKRAGVGTELVNRPGLLFLDEATTGLDPGLERRMMELMRELASNDRSVITITHATKNLRLCDKVAVMGREGRLSFYGTPQEALDFFGVTDPDDIYSALEQSPPGYWQERWQRASSEQRPFDTATGRTPPHLATHFERTQSDRPLLDQARVLAARYARIMLRDRRNLIILGAQVPIFGLAIAALYHSNVFDVGANRATDVLQILFLLVTIAIWIGSIDAAREIVKERTPVERERAVGVRVGAYLLSKVTVLFALATVQVLVLCLVVFVLRPPPSVGTLIGLILLTAFAGVSMGLLISAAVRNENQATSFIPLALIPQLLFAGQIVPLKDMPGFLRAVSDIIFSRWALQGVGTAVDLNGRFAATGNPSSNPLGSHFFNLSPGLAALILLTFTLVLLAGTGWRVKAMKA